MKVRWDVYPDNIGHLNSPGCFRCHGGRLKTKEGETISGDCSLCHIIMSQGGKRPHPETLPAGGLAFEHPVDIGEAWKGALCSDCHKGALP